MGFPLCCSLHFVPSVGCNVCCLPRLLARMCEHCQPVSPWSWLLLFDTFCRLVDDSRGPARTSIHPYTRVSTHRRAHLFQLAHQAYAPLTPPHGSADLLSKHRHSLNVCVCVRTSMTQLWQANKWGKWKTWKVRINKQKQAALGAGRRASQRLVLSVCRSEALTSQGLLNIRQD